NAVFLGEVIGCREPMPTSTDDHDIIGRFGLRITPLPRPALMAGRCLSEQVEHRISQRMLPVTPRPRWLAGFKPSSHLGAHVAWKRQTDGAEKLVWPCVALSSPGRNPKRIGRRVQCGNWRPLSRLSANGWS